MASLLVARDWHPQRKILVANWPSSRRRLFRYRLPRASAGIQKRHGSGIDQLRQRRGALRSSLSHPQMKVERILSSGQWRGRCLRDHHHSATGNTMQRVSRRLLRSGRCHRRNCHHYQSGTFKTIPRGEERGRQRSHRRSRKSSRLSMNRFSTGAARPSQLSPRPLQDSKHGLSMVLSHFI